MHNRRSTGGTSGPTPPPSTGMVAWFRKGVGQVGAGFCSQWTDQSGNGNNLLQATGANQPTIPGDGTLLFDGLSQFMKCTAFTLNQAVTAYFRFKHVAIQAGFGALFDGNVAGQFNGYFGPTLDTLSLNAGVAFVNQVQAATNTYVSAAFVMNGASSVIQVGGTTATGNAGTNNAGGFTLCAQSSGSIPGNMQVAEVIVYNVAHDATQRAAIITYLNTL